MKTYTRLDWSLVSRFGDRKEFGYLSIIIDVNTRAIYIVPRDTEHIDALCKILVLDRKDIRENSERATHLVPSLIELKEEEVFGVLSGFSGAESGYGIRHTAEQLNKAHAIALKFVEDGTIPKHLEFNDKIVYRYVQR